MAGRTSKRVTCDCRRTSMGIRTNRAPFDDGAKYRGGIGEIGMGPAPRDPAQRPTRAPHPTADLPGKSRSTQRRAAIGFPIGAKTMDLFLTPLSAARDYFTTLLIRLGPALDRENLQP